MMEATITVIKIIENMIIENTEPKLMTLSSLYTSYTDLIVMVTGSCVLLIIF